MIDLVLLALITIVFILYIFDRNANNKRSKETRPLIVRVRHLEHEIQKLNKKVNMTPEFKFLNEYVKDPIYEEISKNKERFLKLEDTVNKQKALFNELVDYVYKDNK